MFEKAQSKGKQKFMSKELVLQYFVVFLKCTLEKGLVGLQQLTKRSQMAVMK